MIANSHSRLLIISVALLFSTMLISCQTSCASDDSVKKQTSQPTPHRQVMLISDLNEEDFVSFSEIIYGYLNTGEFQHAKLPELVKLLKEELRVILTVSTNDEQGGKYFFEFKDQKLNLLNKSNKLDLPFKTDFKLRLDFIYDEQIIEDMNMNHKFDFINDYYALKLEKGNFFTYLLPEELISQNLIDEKSKHLKTKHFFKYLKTLPEYTEEISYAQNLKTFTASICDISTFYCDGKKTIKLLKGFQHFASLSLENLEYAYKSAGNYLKNKVRTDGRFAYEYNPGRNAVSKSYNILRHCGTIYSMLEVYEMTKDESLLASAKKAMDYAIAQMEEYTEDSVCIVEDDVLKLGGNGLVAIALSKYIEQTGDKKHLELLKKIGKWFQIIQEPNGKFKFHKQIYSSRKIIDDPCAYYPGEALLGIMRIYALTKDESLVKTAVAGAKYIINIRDKDTSLENTYHDHWLLYALNEIHRQEQHPEFLEKSQRIVKSMLMSMNKSPLTPEIIGSYYSNPRSTPTATRSEGILAAYKLLRDFGHEVEAKEILGSVGLSIAYQLRTQFRPENLFFFAEPKLALGGFQRGPLNYSIRIDYVQHNISSIINYYKIVKD